MATIGAATRLAGGPEVTFASFPTILTLQFHPIERCSGAYARGCNVKRAEPSPIAYDADEDDMPLHSDGSATE